MLGIGGGEMVALAILALLVFGPEGLPEIMKTVARTIRAFKTAANDFQSEVNTALALETQKSEVQQRRRRRSLPQPEANEQAQLPSSGEAATEVSVAPPAVAQPSSSETRLESTPLEAPQTVAVQLESGPLDDGTLADQGETVQELNASRVVSTEVAPSEVASADEDDEFGPRLPMSRPDRSAEAVLAIDEDETDLPEIQDEELPRTSSTEVEV